MKKKAFEDAGIPVKQISMVQVQSTPSLPVTVPTAEHETIYVKSEVQPSLAIPSTSTAILVEAPILDQGEIIVDTIKNETGLTLSSHADLNLLTNTDELLLSNLTETPNAITGEITTSTDSNDLKMEFDTEVATVS